MLREQARNEAARSGRPTGALRALRGRLRSALSAYEANEHDSARFRAQQLLAVLQLTPVSMLISLSNCVMLIALLWTQVDHGLLLQWGAAVGLVCLWGFRGWHRARLRGQRLTASRHAMRRAVLQSSIFGLLWGVLPALELARLDVQGRFILGMVSTAMICAGGFALSSIPMAAAGYVALLCAGFLVGLLQWSDGVRAVGVGTMVVTYASIVVYCVRVYARTLGARLVAEASSDRQSEVISLLLRDFEDHSSDLLWEIDAGGRFVHVSQRLSGALAIPAHRLPQVRAQAVLRMFRCSDDGSGRRGARLHELLAARQPFRDVVVALGRGEAASWWALSARPLFDSAGVYSGWRGVASDVTSRQVSDRRLRWLAHNDTLTGLVNRGQFRDRLMERLGGPADTSRPVAPIAVLLIDLDGFKQVNDTAGHAAGDALLKAAGRRLSTVARSGDIVARLGGDEFALLVHGVASRDDVTALMARLLQAMDEPLEFDGRQLALRASIGVALAPAHATDVDSLLKCADVAMYAAKRDGGHRWVFYEPRLAAGNRRRALLQTALQSAIARGELRLEFQPQVDAQSWQVSGFEALLRWRHPELGDVPPSEFIGIAESAGLMPRIDDWVLQQACRQAETWPAPLSVSVNISATQLGSPDLIQRVVSATGRLAAGRVELEITESSLIDNPESVVVTLQALRARGYRVALDDFGTGYSALGYLRRFAFDTLKIDRSFVRDLARDGDARVILDTILAMSGALGMATVAEGVEQRVEAQMLRDRGCTTLQGFFFSRPLPVDEVPAFIARGAVIDEPQPAAPAQPLPAIDAA